MELTARQQRALAAICDTFAPREDGLPSASELGVPDAIASALFGHNPRPFEHRQFRMLLNAWDTPPLTALGGGGLKRFSDLPHDRREAVLRSWIASRVPQRRGAYEQLRRATLLHTYMMPGPYGGPNPRWDAIGYPGPLGPAPDAPPRDLEPERPARDTDLECDVVIVGSGAGGGTAAGVLAQQGLDVVVLEAGDYYDTPDFKGDELDGVRKMYLNAGAIASDDGSMGVLAGACLGGGTVINYTTSFPTPQYVRDEWAGLGVPAFAGEEYAHATHAVMERLGVNAEMSAAAPLDAVMERGLRELGWHVDQITRNVSPECDMGVDCGRCGFGCRRNAKRSVAKTWLVDAAGAGARILIRTKADRIVVKDGAATGVEATTADGHRVTVKARAVVAAAGAVHTPALLRRSGLRNRNIGRHLRLHPVQGVFGIFDEEIRGWEGVMQARYSDELGDLDGEGYGVKYETGPMTPTLLLTLIPWASAKDHLDFMRTYPHIGVTGVILRDRDSGEVKVGRDGHPFVRYRISKRDQQHVRKGVEGAAKVMEAAGARRIRSSHTRLVEYRPGQSGSLASFMAEGDGVGYGPGQMAYSSFHIMGSARMGGSPETAACSPEGETWEVRGLVVCDASTFPTASGVNPMISIESIAHMNASRLATRLA